MRKALLNYLNIDDYRLPVCTRLNEMSQSSRLSGFLKQTVAFYLGMHNMITIDILKKILR